MSPLRESVCAVDTLHTTDLDGAVEERLARLDLATKVRLLQGETNWRTFGAPAAGMRQVVTSDGPVGARGEA